MIELRWVEFGKNKQLEYRTLEFCIDASGSLCPGTGWTDWIRVNSISGDEAAYQDLINSGGLSKAP